MTTLRNRVHLVGNLGMNPEIVTFDSGSKLVKFTVATNETMTINGEVKKDTQWHNVVAWGKQAEIAEKQLHKGSEVALEGKLSYRNYTDKAGNKRYVTEIMITSFIIYPGERDKNKRA